MYFEKKKLLSDKNFPKTTLRLEKLNYRYIVARSGGFLNFFDLTLNSLKSLIKFFIRKIPAIIFMYYDVDLQGDPKPKYFQI